MTTPSKHPQFLLLLRQPHSGPHPSPAEMQAIMGRFMQWMKAMSDTGVVVGTNGLEDTGKVLRGPRGAAISDGPYAESKEIVGGYVLVTAENLEQAVELARDCPGLDHRMVVEVRPVKRMHEA
ncbi:MAG TPA: YciI family protein [Labilithrix sp.]|nr:YciI family protein [Labilithrix sp.]